MNCAQAAKKFADWADAAGKPDLPINVNVTRSAIMTEAARSGIEILPKTRGGPLFLGDHPVVPIRQAKQKTA